jgi:hypothetical protein
MNTMIRLESVNGSPVVEWRAIDGTPIPYQVTIQRRMLTPDGDEFIDGGSEWSTVSIREALEQLRLNGPVADWLRNSTRVNCAPQTFARYRDMNDSAYLWNVNA